VRELENTIESIMVSNCPEVLIFSISPMKIRVLGMLRRLFPIKIGTPLEAVEKEILIQT